MCVFFLTTLIKLPQRKGLFCTSTRKGSVEQIRQDIYFLLDSQRIDSASSNCGCNRRKWSIVYFSSERMDWAFMISVIATLSFLVFSLPFSHSFSLHQDLFVYNYLVPSQLDQFCPIIWCCKKKKNKKKTPAVTVPPMWTG